MPFLSKYLPIEKIAANKKTKIRIILSFWSKANVRQKNKNICYICIAICPVVILPSIYLSYKCTLENICRKEYNT